MLISATQAITVQISLQQGSVAVGSHVFQYPCDVCKGLGILDSSADVWDHDQKQEWY